MGSFDGVDTPALLLDLDKVERNLDRMAALFAPRRVKLRPHAKTHKTAVIAQMQLARGAIGVCCAKLGEAEVLANAGVGDILITTEIVGAIKIDRLLGLARRANVTIVVDSADVATPLSRAAAARGITLQTLVDLDVGQHRTGVAPGDAAMQLARAIDAMPGLTLLGLQGYEGHLQHIADPQERSRANAAAMDVLCATAKTFATNGLSTNIVTTGGTGTGIFAAEYSAITDIQPGSYVMMDAEYGAVGGIGFENALTVMTTVISVRDFDAIVDAGLKSLGSDAGVPYAPGLRADFSFAGDEHGKLTFAGAPPLRVGDRVEIVPGHCDTTINLHDAYVVHRDGVVADRWPIIGRGRVQ